MDASFANQAVTEPVDQFLNTRVYRLDERISQVIAQEQETIDVVFYALLSNLKELIDEAEGSDDYLSEAIKALVSRGL